MDSSQHIIMYNGSCTLDISIFISLSQAPLAYHFLGIGNLLCSLTALTGNAIILLALRRCSSLHPSSKALFSSLAISDFGVDLVAQPLFAAYTLAIAWDNPGLFCIVGLPYSLFSSFLGLVSFCTISVVALDRHLALILRFRYRRIVTFKRVTLILMVAWFLSAFFTVSGTFSMNLRRIASNLMLVSSLLLALFFYLKTYTNLCQHKLRMESSFGVSYYRKSTNSMFIAFCLFFSTYLPFIFALVVATAFGFSSFPQLFALDITSFLALLNSPLNPVVYCWRIKEIQREAKQLIRNSHSCYSIILGRFFQSRVMPLNTSQGVQPVYAT